MIGGSKKPWRRMGRTYPMVGPVPIRALGMAKVGMAVRIRPPLPQITMVVTRVVLMGVVVQASYACMWRLRIRRHSRFRGGVNLLGGKSVMHMFADPMA